MNRINRIISFFVGLLLFSTGSAQILDPTWNQLALNSHIDWYGSNQAREVAENVLLYQRDNGGWPKNHQMQRPLSSQEVEQIEKDKEKASGTTIDNGATYTEMVFLANRYAQRQDEKVRKSFLSGLDYLMRAQYDSGGWPQFYPLREGYYSQITYNDDAMANVLRLMKQIMVNEYPFDQLDISLRTKGQVALAFQKGINCILRTQYKQNGKLTGWGAQHDTLSFLPTEARSYELPSLSGQESAKLILLLMDLQRPSPQVVKAVEAAVEWLKDSQIRGIRVERIYDEDGKLKEKKVVKDDQASPLWGRFMELDDNSPFFSGRDGVKKQQLHEISKERRLGYRWFTNAPQKVLDLYPEWRKRIYAQRSNPQEDLYNIVVAQDGSGHFSSIQEAIISAKAFPPEPISIQIKIGIYNEKVQVHEWNPHITMTGENLEKTIITYDDYFDKINLGRNSTFHTATLKVDGNDFRAENLTIKNTAGPVGQAVALSVNATRASFENCSFLGHQDTIYTSGEGFVQYFKNCRIEGTTDFIFGAATVLFEDCVLHSKSDSFVTAASTPERIPFGFVFKNCSLTADTGVSKVYLGRPWRTHAKTVFIDCEMDEHITPIGWDNWNNEEAESKSFYAEHKSAGPGSAPKKRVNWSHQLTESEVKQYTKANILGSAKSGKNKNWYD